VFGKIVVKNSLDENGIEITPKEYLALLKFIGSDKIKIEGSIPNSGEPSITIEHEKNFESPKSLEDLFTLKFEKAEKKLYIIPNFKSD
jgi:hypothetical protein